MGSLVVMGFPIMRISNKVVERKDEAELCEVTLQLVFQPRFIL